MSPNGLVPIRKQISYLVNKHTNGRKLPDTIYNTMFKTERNELSHLVLDKYCGVQDDLRFVIVSPNITLSTIGHELQPVNISPNTTLLTNVLTSKARILMTITKLDNNDELIAFACKYDIYVLFNKEKYVYLYDYIKESKKKLHEDMLSSEMLARIICSPARVQTFIDTNVSDEDDLAELSFDKIEKQF